MSERTLFHGAKSAKILSILESGTIVPDGHRHIYFARSELSDAFMHGGDLDLGAAFVVEVRATIPPDVIEERIQTPGVRDTLLLRTERPIPVTVVRLHVREPRASETHTVDGEVRIRQYLEARQGKVRR